MLCKRLFLLIFLIFMLHQIEITKAISTKSVKMKDFDQIRLDEKGYNKTMQIHYNWYLHSIKALMGEMGKQLMRRISSGGKRKLLRCLDRIHDKKDIVSAARCLIAAKLSYEEMRLKRADYKNYIAKKDPEKPAFVQEIAKIPEKTSSSEEFSKIKKAKCSPEQLVTIKHKDRYKQWIGGFRVLPPTEKVKKFTRQEIGQTINLKPFLAKKLEIYPKTPREIEKKQGKSVKKLKFMEISDEEVEKRIQLKMTSFIRYFSKNDGNRVKKWRKRFKIHQMAKMPPLNDNHPSPVQKISRMIVKMVRGENDPQPEGGWAKSYESILNLKKSMDRQAKQPGAKVYDLRMYDLVLGRDHPSGTIFDRANDPGFVQETYNLASHFGNSKKGGNQNFKFLSPRIAPVMPDKYGPTNRTQLSPSILSFYKDDAEDQILPLPKLLETAGLKPKDRESVLEMIMEVSGARPVVDDAMKVISKMNLFGMEGEILDVTKRTMNIFKNLEASFNGRQQKEMKKRGYTFALPHQLEKLHEEQGILERKDHGFDYSIYRDQSRAERENSLWMKVYQIANNASELTHSFEQAEQVHGNATYLEQLHRRVKRACDPPCLVIPNVFSVLNPTVLAPFAFTPIIGLAVLGPVILSPLLFTPVILAPSVLSPYVFSPAVGIPFILSPYLLSPDVLSPLVMAPFVLNPYCLAPNVINPYVLSPLILSPFCLCPDLVSPMVLGGAVLSPSVLSPSLFSPSFLMASILSPTFLS